MNDEKTNPDTLVGKSVITASDDNVIQAWMNVDHKSFLPANAAEDPEGWLLATRTLLAADLPEVAFKPIPGQAGLTNINTHHVMAVLDEVFGLCGVGWRYAVAPPKQYTSSGRDGEERTEITRDGILQYRVPSGCGTAPVIWMTDADGFASDPQQLGERDWSAPIYMVGCASIKWGLTPYGDALKGTITNMLGRAASMLGIARNQVYASLDAPAEAYQYPVSSTTSLPEGWQYLTDAVYPPQTVADIIANAQAAADNKEKRFDWARAPVTERKISFLYVLIRGLLTSDVERALEIYALRAFNKTRAMEMTVGQALGIEEAIAHHRNFKPAKNDDGSFVYIQNMGQLLREMLDDHDAQTGR